MPRSTIKLSLNCFKVPLIQKYWKQLIMEIIAFSNQLDPNLEISFFIYTFQVGTRFRNFAFHHGETSTRNVQSTKVWVFWEFFCFFLIALLDQGMAPISSLTWHLKKCGKGGSCHNCLDLFCVHLHCQCFVFGFSSSNIQ